MSEKKEDNLYPKPEGQLILAGVNFSGPKIIEDKRFSLSVPSDRYSFEDLKVMSEHRRWKSVSVSSLVYNREWQALHERTWKFCGRLIGVKKLAGETMVTIVKAGPNSFEERKF